MSVNTLIRAILSPLERKIFSSLSSPIKVQDYLEKVPTNFELTCETNHSPRQVLEFGMAHCFEGAVFAAAVLAYHGHRPLLMDFATAYDDEDHTVALFNQRGRWGAISKTNHSVLRYRDAVYKSPRELAMSYFHEYYLWDGRKSLRAYSYPFDLSKFEPVSWVVSDSNDWLMTKLAQSRYAEIAPRSAVNKLRNASSVELEALRLVEWRDPRDNPLDSGKHLKEKQE